MKGTVTVVIGGQFGSEAKGKVISYLAPEFNIGVRTGSPNAGHTIFRNGRRYSLQHIPATFVNARCALCIGGGALINPAILKAEVEQTKTKQRLYVDRGAGIIEPKHIRRERGLRPSIGSTGTGGGAAQIDRLWRGTFKRAENVLRKDFQVIDVSTFLNKQIDKGKQLLVEGTQGFGLSMYHGDYPYVTARDTTAANFLAESGLSPRLVRDIILVIRTYPIRVAGNSGPLPHEISWAVLSRRIGKEIIEKTTITKRVRRIAEFDVRLVQRAIRINRPTQIALQFLNYRFPQDEGAQTWRGLSTEAKMYINRLERTLGVPITLIGTKRSNEGMIDRRG